MRDDRHCMTDTTPLIERVLLTLWTIALWLVFGPRLWDPNA